MRHWPCVVAVLVVVGSCSDPTRVPDEDVRITAVEDGLEVANTSEVDLFYQAIDSETLALWAGPAAATLCVEPDCPHVAPGQTVVVSWNDVVGWSEATTRVTVYWWRVASEGEGHWRMEGETLRSREILLP